MPSDETTPPVINIYFARDAAVNCRQIVNTVVIAGQNCRFGEENDGELYQLDNDTILKLMTGGNKELRTSLGNKWSELTNLVINKKYSNIASLLRDGKPIIATKDVLILEYNFDRLVKKTNIKSNQKYLREVVNKLAGIDVFIYGISRSEKVGLIYTFQNLRQIGKLPDPKELEKINFKEMK